MSSLELDMPFALRTNPRLAEAMPGHVHRLLDFGLPEKVYLAQRCPDIVGGWWPDASGEELDLGLDFFAWLFLVDDAFDGLTEHHAEKLIETLIGVVEGAGGNDRYDRAAPRFRVPTRGACQSGVPDPL